MVLLYYCVYSQIAVSFSFLIKPFGWKIIINFAPFIYIYYEKNNCSRC